MKSILQFAIIFCIFSSKLGAQVLYSNAFTSALGTASASNGSNGNWIWTNSCSQSSAGGHSASGHALFQGSGCQFGNGGSTVSGDLSTPTIAIGALGGTLTFNYFLTTECGSPGFTCTYDILRVQISTNGGASFTNVMSSNSSPGGLTETS